MKRSAGIAILAALIWTFSTGAVADAADPKAGRAKYRQLCSICHGSGGKGNGPAARAFPVRPTDQTNKPKMKKLSNAYLTKIITKGGRSIGKSPLMPPFGNQLTPADVRNLIAYIRSLAR